MATVESQAVMDRWWREESDVRTLTEAEKIRSDKSRLAPAQKRAKLMAAEAIKEANAVKKVAGTTPIKTTVVVEKRVAAKKGGAAKAKVVRKRKMKK